MRSVLTKKQLLPGYAPRMIGIAIAVASPLYIPPNNLGLVLLCCLFGMCLYSLGVVIKFKAEKRNQRPEELSAREFAAVMIILIVSLFLAAAITLRSYRQDSTSENYVLENLSRT